MGKTELFAKIRGEYKCLKASIWSVPIARV